MGSATRIKIGISSCLLGEEVRYDGGHKLDRFLTDTLGMFVQYIPVCPEVECGLPVPREPMHLAGDPSSPRLITSRTHIDHTEKMLKWAAGRVAGLAREGLCGFIFKSNSPSSGMERVKVYPESGIPVKTGAGIFARFFMERFPLLPVEDEGRLHDPCIRENFIERVFAYNRWRELLAGRRSLGALVAFHTRHKLQVLAHSTKHYNEMGRLVAQGKAVPLGELFTGYQQLLMEALKRKATPRKNANVLAHMAGYFKHKLTGDEKQELMENIEAYRKEALPLIVPITLISHYVRKYDEPYLKEQFYLHPHPMELKLRNHV
jgi:uncharacterized protein YbgA (DUF1722 family)/uncharacterized protein YbbK (DUF523 family)